MKHWTEADTDVLHEMALSGYSARDVARALGRTVNCIYVVASKLGVRFCSKRAVQRRCLTPHERAWLKSIYER